MGDEMDPVQKYDLQPRHQALLIKSSLRFFPLSEPPEFSAGVTCSYENVQMCKNYYWLSCFLGCTDRV